MENRKNPYKLVLMAAALSISAICVSTGNAHAQSASASAQFLSKVQAGEQLDYSDLYNSTYNFGDLKCAKTLHYSDKDIASILKIAQLSQTRFRDIFNLTVSGLSLTNAAERYGVPVSSLRDIQPQKDEIAAYIAAYESTGKLGVRRQTLSKLEHQAAPAKSRSW